MDEEEKVAEKPEEGKSETEDVGRLISQIKTIEDNFKNEQRISSKKETELQTLRAELDGLRADRELSQSLLAIVAAQKGQPEDELGEEIRTKKPDLLAQYNTLRTRQEAQRKVSTYQRRVEALGLSPNDENYLDVRDLVIEGKYDRAEIRLKKLEAIKEEPPKEKIVETEEERFAKKLESEKLKWMEERGELVTDTGSPAGGLSSPQQAMQDYIGGKITAEDARIRGAVFD